jgi:hypothetical protein
VPVARARVGPASERQLLEHKRWSRRLWKYVISQTGLTHNLRLVARLAGQLVVVDHPRPCRLRLVRADIDRQLHARTVDRGGDVHISRTDLRRKRTSQYGSERSS